jgi:hypothetical protein
LVAASGLLEAFKKMWPDAWGVRMEHVLRNALFTLLEQPEATLADVLRLLNDKAYRSAAVARIRNGQVRQFWITEYDHFLRACGLRRSRRFRTRLVPFWQIRCRRILDATSCDRGSAIAIPPDGQKR